MRSQFSTESLLQKAFYTTSIALFLLIFSAFNTLQQELEKGYTYQINIVQERQKHLFDDNYNINPYYRGEQYDSTEVQQCFPEPDTLQIYNEGMVPEAGEGVPDFRINPAANAIDY